MGKQAFSSLSLENGEKSLWCNAASRAEDTEGPAQSSIPLPQGVGQGRIPGELKPRLPQEPRPSDPEQCRATIPSCYATGTLQSLRGKDQAGIYPTKPH